MQSGNRNEYLAIKNMFGTKNNSVDRLNKRTVMVNNRVGGLVIKSMVSCRPEPKAK